MGTVTITTSHSPLKCEMKRNSITDVTQTRNIISNRSKGFRSRKGYRFNLHHVDRRFCVRRLPIETFFLTALLEGKKLMVRMPSCETLFFSWSELGSILIVQGHLYSTCYTTSCTTSFGIIQLDNAPYYIDRMVL